jgi:hypothetical protein
MLLLLIPCVCGEIVSGSMSFKSVTACLLQEVFPAGLRRPLPASAVEGVARKREMRENFIVSGLLIQDMVLLSAVSFSVAKVVRLNDNTPQKLCSH